MAAKRLGSTQALEPKHIAMQPKKTDISVHIFSFGLVLLVGFGLIILIVEVLGRDSPFLLTLLGWLAFFGIYPAALITLVGALAYLDRPRPPK